MTDEVKDGRDKAMRDYSIGDWLSRITSTFGVFTSLSLRPQGDSRGGILFHPDYRHLLKRFREERRDTRDV